MIGGTVESVTQDGSGRVRIVVTEKPYGRDQYCAIRVEVSGSALLVRPGDSLWWQGGLAFWTPADRSRRDVALRKIGYSFDPLQMKTSGDAAS